MRVRDGVGADEVRGRHDPGEIGAGVAVFWKTSRTPMVKITTPPIALTPWWVLTSRNMNAAPMNMSSTAVRGAPK